jgi:hypothetical protein
MFAGMSTNPDYYKKRLNCFVALAPITSLHKIESKVVQFAAGNALVEKLIDWAGPEVMEAPQVKNALMKHFLNLTPFDEIALDILSDSEPSHVSELA